MEKSILPSNAKLGSSGTTWRGSKDKNAKAQRGGLTGSTFIRRVALILLVLGLFWVFWGLSRQIEEEIFEWTEHEQKVHKSRPHLSKVGRYSNEHRYRPAASPIIKETDRWGRVKHHGQYHL